MAKPIKWTTGTRKISDLVPHPENPRQMTEKQVDDLTESLEKFNLAEIPVINTDNQLLAGHQRCRIMHLLGRGDETVDVRVPTRKLTKDEAREYLIRSNKNTGEWDWDTLANNFDPDTVINWGFEDWELIGSSVERVNDSTEDDEWVGMPDFEASERPLKLIIGFADEAARVEFMEKYPMEIMLRGKTAWSTQYPFEGRKDTASLRDE